MCLYLFIFDNFVNKDNFFVIIVVVTIVTVMSFNNLSNRLFILCSFML